MRTLFLLRHGKSETREARERDEDRRLIDAGRKKVRKHVELLTPSEHPDAIVCSPAKRALESAEIAQKILQLKSNIEENSALSPGSVDNFLEIIATLGTNTTRPLLVGHNPAIEDVLLRITGSSVEVHAGDLYAVDLDIRAWREVKTVRKAPYRRIAE